MNSQVLAGLPQDGEKCGIAALTLPALQEQMAALGQPAYRARQVYEWLHKKQVQSFGEMRNLPAALREALEAAWRIDAPEVVQRQCAQDGTEKYLLRLWDGHCVEAVLMRYKHGNSLCISSQVGCRMGCRFCASGAKNGETVSTFVRNLTAGEMAGQVYAAQRLSAERVGHIVLMGIGEPLDNFDNVMDFVTIITSAEGAGVSGRNLSLSTSGLVPQIRKLAERRLGLTLSVSLHAATDEARSALMPVNKAWPLDVLLEACRDYQNATGRRISYEYALVRGVNDGEADAQTLAALLRGMGAHVNLIPVNPVDGAPYASSDRAAVNAFAARLQSLGINATVRRRLGADIDAACGQLRLRLADEKQ